MTEKNHTPGPLEMEILEVLWKQGPSNARGVREELLKSRELAYSTVLTVMRRMEAKGMLHRNKVSRSHVYDAAVDRSTFQKTTVRNVVSRLFGGSPSELVLHLVREQKISAKELSKIEELFARRKGKK